MIVITDLAMSYVRVTEFFWSAAAVVAKNVTLEGPHEATCPGEEAVFTCTVVSRSKPFALTWKEAGTSLNRVAYVYGDSIFTTQEFDGFSTAASTAPYNYSLVSTATLRGALFNHNKYAIECSSPPNSSSSLISKIAGKPLSYRIIV